MKSLVKVILFAGLAVLIWWLLTKNNFQCQQTIIKSDTTTVYDTAWSVKIEKYPVYKPGITITIHDTSWKYTTIDTMAILRDFYAKNVYNDTVWLDSFGYVCWVDTVTRNKIAARQKSKNYKLPTITKTVTINNYYQQSRQANITAQIDPLTGTIYSGLSYEDRKDRIYHVSAGLNKNGYGIMVGASIPVWKESTIMKKTSK